MSRCLHWLLVALLVLGPATGFARTEAATGAAAPHIVFLAGERARRAIVDDRDQPYFSLLQPLEMAAKTGAPLHAHGLAAQRAETRRRYQAGVRDFTPQEQTALRALVGDVYRLIANPYPRLAQLPWHFIKVSDRIEGGLPHTRGDNIVLSQKVCDELVQAYRAARSVGKSPASSSGPLPERASEQAAGQAAGQRAQARNLALSILLHEQVHVLQRREPALFTPLYTKGWGFRHTAPIALTPWQRTHQILNPDAGPCCWVFPLHAGDRLRFIWPQIVLDAEPRNAQGVPRMPQAMHMLAVQVRPQPDGFHVVTDAQGRPVSQPLLQVSDYTRVFGISYNLYDPNEAAADMFVKLVMYDALVAGENMPQAQRALISHALLPVRDWAQRYLAGPGA